MMESVPISDALFTKTQQRVLGLLYGKPDARLHANEIVRRAAIGRGTVRRELDRLAAAGIIVASREGNQRFYQANRDCPVYHELLGIVGKMAATGAQVMDNSTDNVITIGGKLVVGRRALERLARRFHIEHIYLFGSAARGELRADSDIDILVDFEPGKAPSLAGMVKIQDAFSQLFNGRAVDVATRSILNNPYRKRQIEKDLEELYAA